MGDVIEILTTSTSAVEVIAQGPQGPQGPKGDPGDVAGLPLSTQGDTLYRGASQNERLPIGSTGQILKVSAQGLPTWANESGAVSSVAGKTGVVTLDKNDVGLGNVSNAAQVTSVTGTEPIVSSGGTTPAISISAATTSAAGSMSAADKTKLNGIAAGAEVNVQANWTEADSGSDAFILNKPATFAPSAHSSSHASAGSDALAPSDIGAQSLFTTTNYNITGSGSFTLSASRAQIANIENYSGAKTVTLPTSGNQSGDIAVVRANPSIGTLTVAGAVGGSQTIPTTGSRRYVYDGTNWQRDPVYTHEHEAGDITSGTLAYARGGLAADVAAYNGLVKISGGSTSAVTVTSAGEALLDDADAAAQRTTLGLGTAATAATGDFAAASHTHELTALAATGATNGHVLTANGSNGVTFAALPASGVTGAAASASDVLGVSGANITGVDANADRIVFWDDSASALKHLTVGSGLSLTDTTLTATGGGVTTGSVDNAIIRADGTGGSTSQGSAFIIADNATASPNNTVNHASIQATGDTTNVSVSIVPKGTGSLSLHVPDATATGGNARGANAVDLQTVRDTAAKVASGAQSAIIGGRDNTASGTGGVIAAGYSCTVSQSYAFIGGGFGQSVSGQYSGVVGGRDANISGQQSAAVGANAPTVSGENAVVCGGFQNQATANNAFAIGRGSLANRFSLMAHGNIPFAVVGDSQRIRAVLRCKTTTNAAVEMSLDGSTAYLTIPSGKVIFCNIKVVGVKSDGSVVATYERQYAAKNVAGTSSEVFAPVTIGTDNASSTSLEVATVDAGDYIRIRPTGIASETWRWVASVDAVEVAYGT